MNDLRERANYDAEAHAPDERTQYDLPTVNRIDPADLRTVPMPDLRSPERIDAELAVIREAIERLGDAVTVLMLERELRQTAQAQPRKVDGYE